MPTTAWSTMRGEILRPLGFEDETTTADISSGITIDCTNLADRWAQPDYFNGWYLLFTSQDNSGTARRITDYTSAGSVTLATASGALTAATTSTFEVMRFHPADVLRAFNRARQLVQPHIGIVRDVETLTTGQLQITYRLPTNIRRVISVQLGSRYQAGSIAENLFSNADFETWTNATTASSWTAAGAAVNQEKQTSSPRNYMVLDGSNSARMTAATAEVTLTQNVVPSVATEGVEVNATAWVYTTTANRVSMRISSSDGTAHGGTGWELIKHNANTGATAASISAGVVASASTSGVSLFIDEATLTLGPSEAIERPYEPLDNWEYIPPVAGASDGGTIRFAAPLPELRRLRIVGVDVLSSISADTDTVEVDGQFLEPLYDKTRALLCEERANQESGERRIAWKRLQSEYEGKYQDGVNNIGLGLPRRQFKSPDLIHYNA